MQLYNSHCRCDGFDHLADDYATDDDTDNDDEGNAASRTNGTNDDCY